MNFLNLRLCSLSKADLLTLVPLFVVDFWGSPTYVGVSLGLAWVCLRKKRLVSIAQPGLFKLRERFSHSTRSSHQILCDP